MRARAVQNASFHAVILDLERHPRARELIAARVAQLATISLFDGTPPPTPRELARRLQVPDQVLKEILEMLEQSGLIFRVARGAIRPARSPNDLTLADVSGSVGGLAQLLPRASAEFPDAPEFQSVEHLFAGLDVTTIDRLRGITWAALANAKPARGDARHGPTKPQA